MKLVLLFLIGCIGCSAGQWKHVDRAALVVSSLSLAADGAQTMSAALTRHDVYESNPIMGPRPSPGVVAGYFAAVISVNVLLWAVLPAKWRSVVPLGVTTAQTWQVRENLRTTCVFGVGSC
jgi:hypothetical protein